MKTTQLERQITIKYNWWRDDGKNIKPSHIDALEESANERINEMIKTGFTSGELHDTVRMNNTDGRDGVSYSGWFEVNYLKP